MDAGKIKFRTVLLAGLIGLFAGLLFGLFVLGWWLLPANADVTLEQLSRSAKEDYLRMAIEAYGQNGNTNQARKRFQALGSDSKSTLEVIANQPGNLPPELILDFSKTLQTPVQQSTETQSSQEDQAGIATQPLLPIMLAILGLCILAAVAAWQIYKRKRLTGSQSPQVWTTLNPEQLAEHDGNTAKEPPSEDFPDWALEFEVDPTQPGERH